jgi:hypothetical protein
MPMKHFGRYAIQRRKWGNFGREISTLSESKRFILPHQIIADTFKRFTTIR